MSDDNVTNLPENNNQKQAKNPIDGALNKLREAKLKSLQHQLDEDVKTALNAKIVYDNAMNKVRNTTEEIEAEKAQLATFAQSLK